MDANMKNNFYIQFKSDKKPLTQEEIAEHELVVQEGDIIECIRSAKDDKPPFIGDRRKIVEVREGGFVFWEECFQAELMGGTNRQHLRRGSARFVPKTIWRPT